MGCENCGGNCAGCSGSMELTRGEVDILRQLGQFSFLPVARKVSDMTPVYLEDDAYTREEYSLILQCLEKRGLISVDYDKPLRSFNDAAYAAYPIRGSFALTQRGQQVVELLDVQGID